jgi:lipopolysaccharide heptosyltransferase II
LKILILKPSSLGDVVQTIPVLRLLKLHLPGSEIFWWLASDLSPLLQPDPDLAGLIPFDRQRWRRPWNWNELFASVQFIRRQRFDWVIDLQGLARSGFVAWLANGRFTVGLDDPREFAAGFYDAIVPRPSPRTHAVDWYLTVLKLLNVPIHWNFVWLPQRSEASRSVLEKWAPENSRWVGISPGARWMNKRWPADYYARLVELLARDYSDLSFVVLGAKTDDAAGQMIARVAPKRCLNLAGETTLPELVEWIRRCELVVTNDSGPMHIAAALRKRVVSLFGPTDPRRTGPYFQTKRALQVSLPCVPCLKSSCHYEKPYECLRALTPAVVEQEIRCRFAELVDANHRN